MRKRLAAGALLATVAVSASAQRTSDARTAFSATPGRISLPATPASATTQASTGALILGGLAGAAVVGGVVYLASQNCADFECVLPVLVTTVLAPIAIPAGVHLANDQRGRVFPSIVLSYAAALFWIGAGTLAEHSGHRAWPVFFAAIPVTQLVLAIRVERRTARTKHLIK